MYVCRECEQPINQASEICPYCGADLTASPEDELAGQKKPSLGKVLVYWGAVLAFLAAMLWFALPLRHANPAPQAEGRALGALGQINASLRSYETAEGNFPPSLEPLGDSARGPAQSAQSAGYEILYTPGEPGADGRAHHYVLLARAGNYSYGNFYTDDTGTIRMTRENRPATAQDPPI